MKPAEQIELQAILNAERSLRDARALMGRGKRTLAKRLLLIRDARDILESHLTLQPSLNNPDPLDIGTVEPELPEQPQTEAQ